MNKVLILFAFICLPSMSFALIQFQGVDDITLDAWDGSGGLVGTDDHCIISWRQQGPNQRRTRYDVAGYGPSWNGAGNFKLDHTNAVNILRITYEWTRATTTYALTDYLTSGYITPLQPGTLTCAEANANGTITITLSAAELALAVPGLYSGAMRIDALQANTGDYVIYDFNVNIPELAQINGLDDIDLGFWDNINDMVGADDFCIFRNGSGNFALTLNGLNDAGGSFNLAGAVNIPYIIEFRQGAGAYFAATPATVLPSATSGFTGGNTQDCGGLDNTEIRVTVTAAALGGGSAGVLNDTITILVEPD